MASNDMQVLMYKILKYLYECMKLGKEAKLEDFSYSSELFDVPKSYWLEVISTLVATATSKGLRYMKTSIKTLNSMSKQIRLSRLPMKVLSFWKKTVI